MSKAIKMDDSFPKRKAVVHVLGCKVNQAEAAAMVRILEEHGYEVDMACPEPDLVVVNTCCVTSRAEAKSRRLAGRLRDKFPGARLVITGCLAEVNPSSFARLHGAPLVLGASGKDRFGDYLDGGIAPEPDRAGRNAATCTTFVDMGAHGIGGRARTFLKIQDGCSQRCTYCIVPTARGPSRSLAPDRVIAHARAFEASGYAEIVLTGIHLGAYGRDLGPRVPLEDLLERLVKACAVARFRLSSIEPQEITPGLIALAAADRQVCRHFHVPLQSGDDGVLRRMGRPYDSALIRRLAENIHDRVSDACIGFDIMVGFPGEDDSAFGNTVELIRSSAAAYLHVFPFSPRPGTRAAELRPRVPSAVARERVDELRELSRSLRNQFYVRFLGRKLSVVAESEFDPATGSVVTRSDNYVPVRVFGSAHELRGPLFSVVVEKIDREEAQGKYIHGGR